MSSSRMNARERIENLLDANSFVELGAKVTARNTDYNLGSKKAPGDGVITGYGVIGERMVYVYSQDASVLGGSIGEMHARKICQVYDLAIRTGVPVVSMIDCSGLRLQEANDALQAFGSIYLKQIEASGKIPQICGVFGMCGGGSAVISGLSDFTFMEKENGKLFVNSPNTLDGNNEEKLDTAGSAFQAETAGNVDFVCETESDVLQGMRTLLGALPSDYQSDDHIMICSDDLNRVSPELNESEYDAAYILKEISDDHFYLESKEMYGKSMVTALIRLNGETVAAVANQTEDGKAVLTANGLEKAQKFIRFADAFHLPVLTITNTSGILANRHQERRVASCLAAFTAELGKSTVPKVNLIAGDAFGTAGVVMNSKAVGADLVLAWPEARIGMMDAKAAVQIMYADEIAASEDQTAFLAEKTAQYGEAQESVDAAAARGYVDDVIIPDATRKRLIAAFEMLVNKYTGRPDKKHTSV